MEFLRTTWGLFRVGALEGLYGVYIMGWGLDNIYMGNMGQRDVILYQGELYEQTLNPKP